MSGVRACTAVAASDLAWARMLGDGLAREHPDWSLVVLVLGADPGIAADEDFEVVGVPDLDASGLSLLEVVADGPRSLGTALRPALMATLAERADGPVVWLDPTVRILGPLDALAKAGAGGVALVPLHGRPVDPVGLSARGPFESGAVASDDAATLRWWAELVAARALELGARFDPLAGELLAAVAAAADGARVVRDAALCAGWWTLAAGGRLDDGDPLVLDGRPLRAFNLAGFDPERPHWLSDEDPHGVVRVADSGPLADLTHAHAAAVLAARRASDAIDWPFAALPGGGIGLDDDLRDLYTAALRDGAELGSPFTAEGAESFLDWLGGEMPAGGGVSWYLERVHRRRADLQIAFPDLAGGDGPGLVAWMETHGVEEEPVLRVLDGRARSGRAAGATHGVARATPRVRFVGYFKDGLGLGQAARSYVAALAASGVEAESVAVPVPMQRTTGDQDRFSRRHEVEWEAAGGGSGAPIEVVCMNPPELIRAHRSGALAPAPAYRIGSWAWELDTVPPEWSDALDLVDEIWVYSEHVATAFRQQTPKPIEVMPIAVAIPDAESLPARVEPFTFLFMFDLLSSLPRKNPLGLIAAFRSAFEPGEGPRLVVKTTNGDNEPEELERIRMAAVGRPDIEIVDGFVSGAERDALIASCGCYVSLHRAEGFGLTLAEAMAAGRPVVATAFSGNLDFMTAATSYLVGWRPTRVEAGSPIYPEGATWADPDLDEAAALLRRVHANPAEAEVRGGLGREHVARLLSAEVVGHRLRGRVEQIEKGLGGGRARRLRSALARRRPS